MDVRIGITHTPKEIEVELPTTLTATRWSADIEKLLKTGDGVLWLTDRKGRRVGVPVVKVAYVEVGARRAIGASGSAPPEDRVAARQARGR